MGYRDKELSAWVVFQLILIVVVLCGGAVGNFMKSNLRESFSNDCKTKGYVLIDKEVYKCSLVDISKELK